MLVAVLGAAADAQTPTFSARTNAVEVDVLVLERGRVVRDLQAGDFEVRDNGVVQQIAVVESGQMPLSVVLALDVSDSLDADRRARLREAGRLLLAQLTPLDQAALVVFNERVTLAAPLGHDRARVDAALDLSRGEGLTSLIDATYAAMVTAESGTGRSLLIVLSDGVDSASRLSSSAVLDVASRSDVVVYGVSVGPIGGTWFVPEITTATAGALVEVESNADLGATFVKILDEFRQRYVLTYNAPTVSAAAWRTLEVKVPRRRVQVRARPGYHAVP